MRGARSTKATGLGVAIGLHVLAGAALLSYAPARPVLLAAAPLMVDLIASPQPRLEPQPVEIRPEKPKAKPKPKPVVRPRPKPPEPPPSVVSAPVEAPAPAVVPPPPPEPPRPPEPASPPQQPAPPAPPIAEPGVPPLVVAVTTPIFNADYLHNPPPAYPAASRRAGEQGRVLLRVLVNPAGTADEVEVRTSSGHRRLDQSAQETVRRWKFVPAKRGAQPVAAWVLIPISFRLEG